MSIKLGIDCKLYYSGTAVTEAGEYSGISNEITVVKDVTLNLETGEADVTSRSNNGWRATRATLKEGSIEFEVLWDPEDAAFTALLDAWKNKAEIAMAAMDGAIDTAGSQGLAGNFTVTNFTRNEPLEEAVTVNVTLKPSSYTTWYTVSGS